MRNKNNSEESFEKRPILHPDQLGLKAICCDHQILERCGSLIYKIYDQNQPEVMVSEFESLWNILFK